MKKFISKKPKRPIPEYVQNGICFEANIGLDLQGSRVYFVAYVLVVGEDEVFYGCSWGPKLFNGFSGLLENQPETENFFGPYWPMAVQYVKNQKAGQNETPRLAYWGAAPQLGMDEDAWMLGYYVKGVDLKEIVVLSDSNFEHILKVFYLNMGLFTELIDDHTVNRFAMDHNLYEIQAASPFLTMFGSPKIFGLFGITQWDIGDAKGGMFLPLVPKRLARRWKLFMQSG